MRRWLFGLLVLWVAHAWAAQTIVSFATNFTAPGQFINDRPLADGPAFFGNTFTDWGGGFTSWAGFAFSTVSNTTDGSFGNQYAAAAPHSNAYAVAYDDPWNPPPVIAFDIPIHPRSVQINNTTYAALTIRNGSGFSRPFTDGDYFVLTLTARDLENRTVATTNHYLADFRDGKSFIQTNWTTLDLSWMPPSVATLAGTLETTDMGAFGANTPMYFALADFTYAYAGLADGLAATNPAIVCWADAVTDYTPGANVDAQWKNAAHALGPAEMGDGFNGSTNVVSLGDGGHITLTFPLPITDGPGPDFAVFENAFTEEFLELAFVEVSSDGTNFFRFPNHAFATNPVLGYSDEGGTEADALGGLAGKHLQGHGTPFDLHSLVGTPGLDIRRVTHVRLVDIPGDGSTLDSYGHPIYDPFPTFGSGGFDVNGVGVLNALVEIGTAPNETPPALPGFTTQLEYKASLLDADWLPATDRSAPGFYRWRLSR